MFYNDKEKRAEIKADIKKYMQRLHTTYTIGGKMPSGRECSVLAMKFYERDKEKSIDTELMLVMRGFSWGFKAMQQIITGDGLTEDESALESRPAVVDIDSVCLSYRHDFPLLSEEQKQRLRRECTDWIRAVLYQNK